ncbi:hypothetical protein QO003_002537 [Arthrobacter silviterrae]|uniref:Uncharacterized protein n=1 Tax=Arthrobacter silviterrae TaxID=2026658 RepID=A0ABX0DFE8_9MICC|nr:hypothetical protein [Arthrobacter silviterrae]MDQ0278234.1 hypothetical protein [Arthrobacter silviterrae]NGN84495.1 hypothetical protein [Arthrobacter silviterrae]
MVILRPPLMDGGHLPDVEQVYPEDLPLLLLAHLIELLHVHGGEEHSPDGRQRTLFLQLKHPLSTTNELLDKLFFGATNKAIVSSRK